MWVRVILFHLGLFHHVFFFPFAQIAPERMTRRETPQTIRLRKRKYSNNIIKAPASSDATSQPSLLGSHQCFMEQDLRGALIEYAGGIFRSFDNGK